jgi:hypothetical protein
MAATRLSMSRPKTLFKCPKLKLSNIRLHITAPHFMKFPIGPVLNVGCTET